MPTELKTSSYSANTTRGTGPGPAPLVALWEEPHDGPPGEVHVPLDRSDFEPLDAIVDPTRGQLPVDFQK